MKSYDDLQRFKEKTQTDHIEFKDMSEQSLNSDTTNWAIIKQLLNDDAGSVLEKSQRIDVAAPQPIDPSSFAPPPAPVAAAPAKPAVQSFATTTAASGGSLLDSISSSLKSATAAAAAPVTAPPALASAAHAQHPGLTPAETAAESAALRPAPVAQITSAAGSSLFEQLAAQTPPRAAASVTPLQASVAVAAPAQAPATTLGASAAAPVEPHSAPLQQQSTPLIAQLQQQSTPQSVPSQQPVAPLSSVSASVPPSPHGLFPPAAAQPAAAPATGWVQSTADAREAATPPACNVPPQSGSADIHYKQLFGSAGAAARAVSKESLLQPLLEKIASCR